MLFLSLLPLFALAVQAIDNGLGLTPPMGWRSWNLFGGNVNQSLMMSIMDAIVDKKRMVDGVPTSLCDVGYCDVGLDDGWQKCGGGHKYHYHDDSGTPIINEERFPDMIAMTRHAHALGLTVGWYGNNCMCSEQTETEDMYHSDVAALTILGFDGVKLDGCGRQLDLDLWAKLINGTGRRVMIENCHWGQTMPNATWCPWNFYRTSGDVSASYGSVVFNLLTTTEWADKGLSRPGCWAYPDMLEVGCQHGPHGKGDPGLSFVEMRSHFGAWVIVSSPLTLSHDLRRNDAAMDSIWPVITNKEAIAVNQAWAGHSGSPFKQSPDAVPLPGSHLTVPRWHFFRKPIGGGKVAVLMMNHGPDAHTMALSFADVPGLECKRCKVRDVWERKDLGVYDSTFTAQDLASHDSRFLILEAGEAEEIPVIVA